MTRVVENLKETHVKQDEKATTNNDKNEAEAITSEVPFEMNTGDEKPVEKGDTSRIDDSWRWAGDRDLDDNRPEAEDLANGLHTSIKMERLLEEDGSFLDLLAGLPSPWLMLAGDSNMRYFFRGLLYRIKHDLKKKAAVIYMAPFEQHRRHPHEILPYKGVPENERDPDDDDDGEVDP